MSDGYQNALYLTSPASNAGGRTWSKWFYEHIYSTGITIKDSSGSNWADGYKDIGVNGATVDGYEGRFDITGDTYDFSSSDVGRYLTITGFSGGYGDRDGVYRIRRVVSTKVVILEITRSVHDTGLPYPFTGLNWRLWAADTSDTPTTDEWFVYTGTATQAGGFNFDVKVTVGASGTYTCYFPQFEVGPYGDWNATSHSWDSTRHIDYGFINKNNSIYNADNCFVVASTSSDVVVVATRVLDTDESWHITYIGEIDVNDDATDTNPVIMVQGSNSGSYDRDNLIGPGVDTTYTDIYNGARWLAASDNTQTVTGYLCYRCVTPWGDNNMCSGMHKSKSYKTYNKYDSLISVECRDWASNGERRGWLRNLFMSNEGNRRCSPYGVNAEKLHIFGGLSILWNGSNIHEPRIN